MLITEVNDQTISNSEDFTNVMNETYADQVINTVLNKGTPETYQVTLSDKGSYYSNIIQIIMKHDVWKRIHGDCCRI